MMEAIGYWLLAVLSAAATKIIKLAAVGAVIALLVRQFNKWRGFDFKGWIDAQENNPDGLPLAMVFGAVVIGLSVLAAFV